MALLLFPQVLDRKQKYAKKNKEKKHSSVKYLLASVQKYSSGINGLENDRPETLPLLETTDVFVQFLSALQKETRNELLLIELSSSMVP